MQQHLATSLVASPDTELAEFLRLATKPARYYAHRVGLAVEDGEDGVQEIALKFLQAPELARRYEPPQKLRSVYRRILNERTRRRRLVSLSNQPSNGSGLYLVVEPTQFRRLLYKQCLKQLLNLASRVERNVLVLFLKGWSFTEIGAQLGVSPQRASQAFWNLADKGRRSMSARQIPRGDDLGRKIHPPPGL